MAFNFSYQFVVEAEVSNCFNDNQIEKDKEFSKDDICRSRSSPSHYTLRCEHRCKDGTCLDRANVTCDKVYDCPDGSDEHDCVCHGWQCHSGYCLDQSQRCDGVQHCSDGSDEQDCPSCDATQFRCLSDGRCINGDKVCDKNFDCYDASDEKNCSYRNSVCWPEG